MTVTWTGVPGMTLSAEIDICPGITVDETGSLVSRDCDKGFLGRPRDVYILHKNKNIGHSPRSKKRRMPAALRSAFGTACCPHC